MTTTNTPSLDELAARARDLVPAIRQRAAVTEQTRTVPAETIEELREAGLFRLYQPARYGGFEMDWGAQIDLARIVGSACGSTAWLLTVLATHSAMVGRLDGEAQSDVWAENDEALVATGSARIEGEAVPVDGGYLVQGVWRFASGVDHSQWTMVAVPVEGTEAEGTAALRQCLIPAEDYRIVDDWYVSGLRGTGSKQVVVDAPLFVPEHRTLGFLDLLGPRPPGAEVNDGYVYRMEFGPYFGTILLGPVLGIAEGALEDYLDLTRVKVGVVRGNRVAESQVVQLRVAESAAEIAASGLLVERMLEMLHLAGEQDNLLTPRQRVETMRDRAYATRLCVDAVHRLVRQMGATGLSEINPVQRHFRDISAAQGQIGLNWDHNAGTYGKWVLGVATGDRTIDGSPAPGGEEAADSIA